MINTYISSQGSDQVQPLLVFVPRRPVTSLQLGQLGSTSCKSLKQFSMSCFGKCSKLPYPSLLSLLFSYSLLSTAPTSFPSPTPPSFHFFEFLSIVLTFSVFLGFFLLVPITSSILSLGSPLSPSNSY